MNKNKEENIKIKTNFTEEEKNDLDNLRFQKVRNKIFYWNCLLSPNSEIKNLTIKNIELCTKLYSGQNIKSYKYFFTSALTKMIVEKDDTNFNICVKNIHNNISDYLKENFVRLNYCQKDCSRNYSFVF